MSSDPTKGVPAAAATGTAAPSNVVNSIRQASRATNVDFGYLMAQAKQESGFRADAAAPTSSARGLFQFIESTWLTMVQKYGDKYGAGDAAKQIETDSRGRATVKDPAARQQILALRNDPALSASMAAEYARSNKDDLEQALGRPANGTDLYLAHFLGSGGATAFLKQAQKGGDAVAADVLPDAAAANRSVFYDRQTGEPRTVSQVYKSFAAKIEGASTSFADAMGAAGSASAKAPMPLVASKSGSDASAGTGLAGLASKLRAPPLIAMFNVIAVGAMKAMGSDPPKTGPTETGAAPAAAAAAAPTATADAGTTAAKGTGRNGRSRANHLA